MTALGFALPVWERLKAVIAKAAPPSERAAAVYLDPVPDDANEAARLNALMETWRKTVSGEDPARTIELLASLELSEAQVRAGFRSVVCKDGEQYPDWVHGIGSFLAAVLDGVVAQPEVPLDDAVGELKALHAQLTGIARASIATAVGACTIPIAETAKSDMAALFAARAMKALGPSVTFEKNLAVMQARITRQGAPAALDLSSEGWLYRLELRPGLAFVLGTLFHSWRRNLAECLARLEADQAAISNAILDSAPLGEVIGFKGGAGDPHDGGQAVAILHLAGDVHVVYKTKDLRGAEAFLDLAAHLNNPGRPLDLKRQRMLRRDGYGWEEFVSFEACETTAEVSGYFTRMGMLIRLLQLCEGRDFWLDNIVAHGANPYLIDLETLVQGRDPAKHRVWASSGRLMDILEESVLFTAAVASHVRIAPGVEAEDMGGLTPYRPLRTPFRAQNGDDFVEWLPPDYAPFHGGGASRVNDYLADVLAGYRGLDDAIRAHAPGLLAEECAILEALKAPVRHIVRDTWTYYNIMDASLLPQALEDGIARELSLCRLFKDWSGAPTHARVIAEEIEALRDFDIPLFRSKPDTRSLYSSSGACLGPYFASTAFESLCARLSSVEVFDIELHTDILMSSIETGAAGPAGLSVPRVATAPHGEGDVKLPTVARDIAGSILDSHVLDRETPNWLGLVYDPVNRVQVLRELRRDLLTGTLGLACTFAEVFQVTGERELAQMAQVVCDRIPDFGCETMMQKPGLARFFGKNAAAYTLAHCGAALENGSLQERASTMLAAQADGLGQDLAGWLWANRRLPGPLRMSCPRYVSSDCAEPALSATGLATPFASFVAEEGAVLLVSLETMDGAGMGGAQASTLRTRLEGHYSVGLQNASLGHGTLRALCGTRLLPQVIELVDEKGLTRVEAEHTTYELLLKAQLALSAFSATSDARFRNDALQVASVLYHRKSVTGSWFPDRFAADRHNLSGLWGVPAIARVFAALARASTGPAMM